MDANEISNATGIGRESLGQLVLRWYRIGLLSRDRMSPPGALTVMEARPRWFYQLTDLGEGTFGNLLARSMQSPDATKECGCCGQTLPLSDYHRARNAKDGYLNTCKSCVKRRQATILATPKAVLPAGSTKTCRACGKALDVSQFTVANLYKDGLSSQCKPCQRAYRQQFKEGVARRKRLRTYGMTEDQFDKLLAAAEGKCQICRRELTPDRGRTGYAIDHDHECCSGQQSCGRCVRGLVCQACNWMLGRIDRLDGDPLTWAAAASDYLKAYKKRYGKAKRAA